MHSSEIEIHYYLPEGVHAADAFLIARAESEFIHIIREVAHVLEIDFSLETEALAQGGLRQAWKAFGKNSGQIGCLLTLVTLIITLRPQNDQELVALQKEEARLHIEELKNQLAKDQYNNPSADVIKAGAIEISNNIKIVKRRSNFYESIVKEKKINSITFSCSEDGNNINYQTSVKRQEFNNFIALTGKLPSKIDEDALIYIISPVLRKGRFKWKGEYKGENIEFWINDRKFKEAVLKKRVDFHSGTAIKCILEIKIKVDEVGHLSNSGYFVSLVKSVVDEDHNYLTESGKTYEARIKFEKNQMRLF